MLLELRAENYAVIDRAEARFARGLSLLTGETGAGKSILIDALALLLGGKASSGFVRHGAEKAVVSCLFEATPGANAVLERNGIDADGEGDGILLRRELQVTGKGRVFINNQPATVGVLRELAPELALVHAQGETLGSFDQTQQRILLDRFGGLATTDVAGAYAAWCQTAGALRALLAGEQDRLQRLDLLRFQSREIGDAAIVSAEEDGELEREKRVLANAERLQTAASGAQDLLYESERSAGSILGQARRLVDELARFDERFVVPAQQLAEAQAAVEDVSATVRAFAERVEAGPERLGAIEDRLAGLDRLKRKYGTTLAEVLAFGEECDRQLLAIENRDAAVAELKAREVSEAGAYRLAAERLSTARGEAAARLSKAAEQQINELAMRVRFTVAVQPEPAGPQWTAHGWDAVSYRLATNAGEPLKPLDEIASGGEMSRVMLALKVTVEAAVQARGAKRGSGPSGTGLAGSVLPRTLVFDEIDIGIGGRAAEAVGLKLKALSVTQQVVCITHLPQIAAFADQHYLIEKREVQGRTETDIRQLGAEERVREVARMLSGATVTETSLRHAENLLRASRETSTPSPVASHRLR